MKAVDICNVGLTQLGCEQINSFDDGSTEATVAKALYQINRNDLLAKYPWRFCTFSVELSRLKEVPLSGYKYFYQLPNDFLMARRLENGSYEKDFGIARDRLLTDAEAPILTYTQNLRDEELPEYFCSALSDRLTSRFAIPLTGNIEVASFWMKVFDNTYREAKSQDAQQATTQAFSSDILLDVRS